MESNIHSFGFPFPNFTSFLENSQKESRFSPFLSQALWNCAEKCSPYFGSLVTKDCPPSEGITRL